LAVIKQTAVLLVTIFFLFNCGDYQGQTSNSQKISFEQVEISEKEDCDDPNSDYCAEIKLGYPVFSIPGKKKIESELNDFVKNEILTSIFGEDKIDSFDELINSFFDEYRQFKTDIPDSYQEWFIERSGSVKFYNDDFISLIFSENTYLGGAHPNSYTVFTVLDLNSGNKITLEDIFIADYEPILNKVAEEEFRKLKELEEYEDLDEAGFWFDDNKFSINDNFALSDEGLTFYYNNYEITAYAYGPTELIIPLAKISQLIKDGGILAEFMKQ
jgi:hypothetical protein